jgi:hypothetical protein
MMLSSLQGTLSEYEETRARNIERNNARLRALGLISLREEKSSNAAAWGSKVDVPPKDEPKDDCPPKKRQKKAASSPARRSMRLQGITPDGSELPTEEDPKVERQHRVLECREARMRAAVKYSELGIEKAAKENPTATYDHCLMRVRTMKDKALETRVRVIERAAGKHSVVKMAIFKSCLQDEGMWTLAELASEALERLKALKPPPEV